MAPLPVARLLLALLPRDEHDSSDKPADPPKHSGLSGWSIFVIVAVVIIVLIAAGLFIWTVILKRAMPRTPLTPGISHGIGNAKMWWSNATHRIRNPRSRSKHAGFEPSGISAGRAGGGAGVPRGGAAAALDPDEAWDTRVGQEADYANPFYEETELREQRGAGNYVYGDTTYPSQTQGTVGAHGGERGRAAGLGIPTENPFGDDNAASLRSVSPRPAAIDTSVKKGTESTHSSPKRSVFRESL